MKLQARLILKTASAVFISVAAFPDLAFAAETGSETTSVREKVAGLISQLGSDEYSARENAEKKLAAMGEEAVSVLKTLPKSNDAEANIRIDRILIQFSIAGAKTVAEALYLRRKFLDDRKTELADAAMSKACLLGKPIAIAETLRKTALARYRALHPKLTESTPELDAALCRIMKDFYDAVDCYDLHLKTCPEDKVAAARKKDASIYAYDCLHRLK